jgi:hypothetical protein
MEISRMTIATKPGISTYGKGAKKRPIANFSACPAPAAKNFLTLGEPRITSHESRFTAFPWPPVVWRLTGTPMQTGFAVTLSKQTTVVLFNRYDGILPGASNIAVITNGAEGLRAIAPTIFYSQHPESRIPAKLRKINGLIFSTRNTFPLDAGGHHDCSLLSSTLRPEPA